MKVVTFYCDKDATHKPPIFALIEGHYYSTGIHLEALFMSQNGWKSDSPVIFSGRLSDTARTVLRKLTENMLDRPSDYKSKIVSGDGLKYCGIRLTF